MLRRGIGIGAVTQRPSSNSAGAAGAGGPSSSSNSTASGNVDIGRQMTEKRLADISQAAELLESGIRKFVEEHKNEIRDNAFLRSKVQALAEGCNVDIGAAISSIPRLKPGALGSLIGDTLLGGADNSAAMRRFLSFLSSRVVSVCMRERVLRGPVVPVAVVLRELQKRYPLEELTVGDIVKAVEFLAPLNPNIFILHQETTSFSSNGGVSETGAHDSSVSGDADCCSLFIACRPLDPPSSVACWMSSNGAAVGAAGLSGADALRVVVLANDIARQRRKDAMNSSSSSALRNAAAGGGFLNIGLSSLSAVQKQHQQQNQNQKKSSDVPIFVEKIGLVDGEQRGSYYVRITASDVVAQLAPTSPTVFKSNNNAGGTEHAGGPNNKNGDDDRDNVPWTMKRARMALKAARAMHEGWFDAVDRSTWLLVLLQ